LQIDFDFDCDMGVAERVVFGAASISLRARQKPERSGTHSKEKQIDKQY
jgi:hypothetical protein